MLQEAKVRAKKRGFEFSITRDDVEMPDRCPVLGIEVGVQFGARADGSPSLDRIDTSRGYVPGNVKIISWRANRIKSDAHIDELRALVQYMEAGAITATKWEAA
jgi:hypothetical protein